MDRKAHLLFCEKCAKRKFDREKGLVCKLTNEQADFDSYCPEFEEDKIEAEKLVKHKKLREKFEGAVGGWIRFANFIIDRIVHYGLAFGVGMILGIINPGFIYNMSRIEDAVISWLLYVVYYIVLEYNFQISIGKLITGTVVVDLDGNRPTLTAIVGRSFSRLVPFEAFSFLGAEASGWHDKWSNTRVIKRSSMKNNFNEDNDILDQEFMTD